jgi:hypothetical protein
LKALEGNALGKAELVGCPNAGRGGPAVSGAALARLFVFPNAGITCPNAGRGGPPGCCGAKALLGWPIGLPNAGVGLSAAGPLGGVNAFGAPKAGAG